MTRGGSLQIHRTLAVAFSGKTVACLLSLPCPTHLSSPRQVLCLPPRPVSPHQAPRPPRFQLRQSRAGARVPRPHSPLLTWLCLLLAAHVELLHPLPRLLPSRSDEEEPEPPGFVWKPVPVHVWECLAQRWAGPHAFSVFTTCVNQEVTAPI